ncbi:hypothetical protein NCC49_002160 [Naganishia albida]|nr:hypothetical protein NCC49_002160 [Naganishia albida]
MVYFFGTALYVGLLLTNAIAILSEERFLAKIGWSTLSYTQAQQSANAGFGQDPYSLQSSDEAATQQGIKQRLIALIGAVRTLMRIPLIVANVLIILYELILG